MTLLTLLYAMAAAAWTAARFTPLATFRPFEVADLFAWMGFLPLLVLVPVALLLRRRRALAFLVVPLVLFGAEYGPAFAPGRRPPAGESLTLLTANLYLYNPEVDAVGDMIEELDADVIALHELSSGMSEALSARLDETHPHRLVYPRGEAFGMGLLSRLPLRERHRPRLGRDACSCQEASVTVGGREVTIISAHPLPAGHGLRSFDPEGRQARTIGHILDRLREVDEPLILMGDLNVADRHLYYRDLRRHLGDSHRDAGWGFGFTWPASPRPVVRIDYVLHSGHWATRTSTTGVIPGSDHRYVLAELVLPER